VAEIKPGGEKNAVAEALAKDDLITALTKFADAGEAMAERCRDAGHAWLATFLLSAMTRLLQHVAHESAKGRA